MEEKTVFSIYKKKSHIIQKTSMHNYYSHNEMDMENFRETDLLIDRERVNSLKMR